MQSAWRWDEFQQVGTDYEDASVVARYDERMRRFRDFEKENRRALEAVRLADDQTLLEIGCGTGIFTLAAAHSAREVYAYDISSAMLDYAAKKAESAGLANIRFALGGLLSCHEAEEGGRGGTVGDDACGTTACHDQGPAKQDATYPAVDVVVSQLALHHLPDFWKAVALGRIARFLKPGGRFLLTDVVFSFSMADYGSRIPEWIESFPPDTRGGAVGHVQREFTTQAWIMEGLLRQAGFRIDRAESLEREIKQYVCSLA